MATAPSTVAACPPAGTIGDDPDLDALVAEIIGRIADKWTMLALEALEPVRGCASPG